ncbi:hypothetical protein BE21_12850 [Sorangium cellulosum]|uniref:Uncharacterized protein n=1 Tax=Sorangium cellulosum TaxID=56 RepID=A0A150U020_SORCE|nr:hypothetical protein BE21_12850 [Sorangium cellulosum]
MRGGFASAAIPFGSIVMYPIPLSLTAEAVSPGISEEMTMNAGKGPLPFGRETVASKEIDFPPCSTFTVSLSPFSVPVTFSGDAG